MSWFYGEPMNDRSLSLYFEGLQFECNRCDLSGTLIIEDKFDMFNKDPLRFAKAYGTFIGYHATVIHPELNGFRGYSCLDVKVVKESGISYG